ncbi:MAG: PASTA domain-containing protein [Acidobacteriota bacterium]|nr:PASTA domain-containing protein [Acidobacteriota bacterium]
MPRWLLRLGVGGAVLVIAGITFVLFAAAGLQVALRLREVSVPNLAGQTVEQATATLDALNLGVRVEPLSRIDLAIPAGQIATQDPAPGLATRSRRSVKVWLSSGPSAGSVPTLLGQSEIAARRRLEEDALALGEISEIRSSRYPSGAVVAQEPPPRGAATRVSVLINRGQRGTTYVMPDLIGVYGSHAAEVLRSRGFRVTVVGDHPYPGIASGVILRQFPLPGFQIAHGEAISLEVSQ